MNVSQNTRPRRSTNGGGLNAHTAPGIVSSVPFFTFPWLPALPPFVPLRARRTDRHSQLSARYFPRIQWSSTVGSGTGEPHVAEHFQPVGMRFAGQQFSRTLADPLGALAPQETPVVEEELEQIQVVWP